MNNTFEELGVAPEFIRSLGEQNLSSPTDIQKKVIPLALGNGDIVAQAPTGTGKTLAFALPMLSKIDRDDSSVQAVVVCPTRELVIQICEVLQSVLKYSERIRVAGLYGGQNIQKQLFCLRKKPQIIVGTPGRMLDHIERKTLKLANVRYRKDRRERRQMSKTLFLRHDSAKYPSTYRKPFSFADLCQDGYRRRRNSQNRTVLQHC